MNDTRIKLVFKILVIVTSYLLLIYHIKLAKDKLIQFKYIFISCDYNINTKQQNIFSRSFHINKKKY